MCNFCSNYEFNKNRQKLNLLDKLISAQKEYIQQNINNPYANISGAINELNDLRAEKMRFLSENSKR